MREFHVWTEECAEALGHVGVLPLQLRQRPLRLRVGVALVVGVFLGARGSIADSPAAPLALGLPAAKQRREEAPARSGLIRFVIHFVVILPEIFLTRVVPRRLAHGRRGLRVRDRVGVGFVSAGGYTPRALGYCLVPRSLRDHPVHVALLPLLRREVRVVLVGVVCGGVVRRRGFHAAGRFAISVDPLLSDALPSLLLRLCLFEILGEFRRFGGIDRDPVLLEVIWHPVLLEVVHGELRVVFRPGFHRGRGRRVWDRFGAAVG